MNSRFSLVIGACILALTFSAVPVLAHHGWGGNEDKDFEMSGTVTRVVSLFGAVLVLDLRLLGFWRTASLTAISRPTVPIAATGFAVAAASGICMLATNGTDYAGNPFIYIKFPAIGLGLLNVAVLNFSSAW